MSNSRSNNNQEVIADMLELNNTNSNTLSTVASVNSTTPAPPERSMSHLTSNTPSPRLYHRSVEDSLEPQESKRKKLNYPALSETHHIDSSEEIKVLNRLALSTIDAVLNDLPLEHSIAYLSNQFMKLCKSKHLQQNHLVNQINDKLQEDFSTRVKPQIEEFLETIQDPLEFCEKFLDLFDNWYRRVVTLNKVFIYLDTNYLAVHSTRIPLLQSAIKMFSDYTIGEDANISTHLKEQFNDLLLKWRESIILKEDGMNIDDHLYNMGVKFTKLMYQCHTSFVKEFELEVIESVVNHYRTLRQTWLVGNKTSINYIQQVFKAMNENIRFFSVSIDRDYFIKILFTKLRWVLIFENFNDLISKTIDYLISNPKSLLIIYGYCQHTEEDYGLNAMNTFAYQWEIYTKSSFQDIIGNHLKKKTTGYTVIHDLVSKFKFFENIVEQNFMNDQIGFKLRSSLTKSVNFLSNYKSFIIYQLAKYCDSYFRQKLNTSYEGFEESFLIVLKAIGEKLDLVDIYKRDVSKRMLFSSRFNEGDEFKLVTKLIEYLGPADESHSLTVMFNDFLKSSSKYSNLVDIPKTNGLLSDSFKFEPLILTKKEWPDIPNNEDLSEFKLHHILQALLDNLTTKYHGIDSNFSVRQLDWSNYKLHQVTISATFKQGVKEITGNLLQILVILLFDEDNNGYTIDQIEELTGLNLGFLLKLLNSITTEKYKILFLKDGKYYFNDNFIDKSKSIKLPMIRETTSKGEQQQQQQRNQEEYQEQQQLAATIQANRDEEFKSCIVKLMKQEKQLDIHDLLNRSITFLQKKQSVDFSRLKVIIEKLIETEYLKRDDNDKNVLVYIP